MRSWADVPPTPPISLVIPAYNRASLIGETIESALVQEPSFREIVVVNDGSVDATAEVLATFGSSIRVIQTKNQGVQAARNTGIRATHTPLVTINDSDDLLVSGFVAAATACMETHAKVDILYSNFVSFLGTTVSRDKFSSAPSGYFEGATRTGDVILDIPDLYRRNVHYQPFFQSGCTFRRDFFERIGGFNTAFRGVGAEDWEFTLRAIAEGEVAALCKIFVRVRRHAGNDSADGLHMTLGEIKVLEHALAHHVGAAAHADVIASGIEHRLCMAFNAAFAQGDLGLTRELWTRLGPASRYLRTTSKQWIAQLPSPLARQLWRVTQMLGRK